MKRLSDFDKGFIVGLLVGEGHFGVSKRQKPVIAVKMHARSKRTLEKIHQLLGGDFNGPYQHEGRVFYTWQIRAPKLSAVVDMLYDAKLHETDDHVGARFLLLRARLKPDPKQQDLF